MEDEINLEKAKEKFIKYTEKYALIDKNTKRKQFHSLRVMDISKIIAENLDLSQEEIKLATLIGLLHDIGRFEQYSKYHTFRFDTIDHGDLGFQILEKDLRNYIKTDKYDNIIKIAVKNHNKYKIQEGITTKEELFSKIVRDADKIDILNCTLKEVFEGREQNVEKCKISESTIKEFKTLTSMKNKSLLEDEEDLYEIIKVIAFIFDINFKVSFQFLKDKNCINNILDKYQFENEKTKKSIKEIRNIANDYIEEQIKKI